MCDLIFIQLKLAEFAFKIQVQEFAFKIQDFFTISPEEMMLYNCDLICKIGRRKKQLFTVMRWMQINVLSILADRLILLS